MPVPVDATIKRLTRAEIAQHVLWMRRSLGSLDLPTQRRHELLHRLQAIEARAADPNLYVAVVGESSAGKSTLLNAFLRRRMLPSSVLITTRTTMALHQGTELDRILFTTPDGERLTWPSAEFGTWSAARFGTVPATPEAALELLLTRAGAEGLRDLQLWSPTRVLAERVVLIDTPGFSVEEAGHHQLAEQAVHGADLILVVLPAVAAASMTLLDFLAGPASAHADRCAFAVTKMDLLDARDQDDVVQLVVQRLSGVGITHPVVLPCAPEPALRELDRPGSALRAFAAVEKQITALAEDRRDAAIEATLLLLLTDLLAAVELDAAERGAQLADAAREAARLSLPDFDGFLATWSTRSQAAVHAELVAVLAAHDETAPASSAAMDALVSEAVEGERIADLAQAAATVAELVTNHLRAEAATVFRPAAARVENVLERSATALAQDFSQQYRALAGLAGVSGQAPASRPVDQVELRTPELSGLETTLTEMGTTLTSTGRVRATGAAVTGAAIGSLVLPVPILGAAFGAWVGARLATPGNDRKRERFLAGCAPLIEAAQDEVRTTIETAIQEIAADAELTVAELAERYHDTWSGEIDTLTRAGAARQSRLREAIGVAQQIALAARRRREGLLRRSDTDSVPGDVRSRQ